MNLEWLRYITFGYIASLSLLKSSKLSSRIFKKRPKRCFFGFLVDLSRGILVRLFTNLKVVVVL